MVLPIVGAMAKAAIPSLIGGLFGGSKKQTTRTNFKQLVKDAQAAGFNPLTALQATGGSGNRTTTLPTMSSAEFIANAMGDALGAGLSYDPLAKRRQQLEVDIMEAELGRLSRPQSVPSTASGFPSPPSNLGSPRSPGMGTGIVADWQEGDLRQSGIDAADPELPREAEADLWSWGLKGNFGENISRVIGKNMKSAGDYKEYEAEIARREKFRLDEDRPRWQMQVPRVEDGRYSPDEFKNSTFSWDDMPGFTKTGRPISAEYGDTYFDEATGRKMVYGSTRSGIGWHPAD